MPSQGSSLAQARLIDSISFGGADPPRAHHGLRCKTRGFFGLCHHTDVLGAHFSSEHSDASIEAICTHRECSSLHCRWTSPLNCKLKNVALVRCGRKSAQAFLDRRCPRQDEFRLHSVHTHRRTAPHVKSTTASNSDVKPVSALGYCRPSFL